MFHVPNLIGRARQEMARPIPRSALLSDHERDLNVRKFIAQASDPREGPGGTMARTRAKAAADHVVSLLQRLRSLV
jgi:hypothetical protein